MALNCEHNDDIALLKSTGPGESVLIPKLDLQGLACPGSELPAQCHCSRSFQISLTVMRDVLLFSYPMSHG